MDSLINYSQQKKVNESEIKKNNYHYIEGRFSENKAS